MKCYKRYEMGKNSYQIGYWTKGTLRTLELIADKNNSGHKPKPVDLINGTLINWAYILKKGGYLTNGDGFALSDSGKQLLEELRKHPPIDRRGRSRSKFKQRKNTRLPKSVTTPPTEPHTPAGCQISIRGNDVAFDAILSKEQALEAINAISTLLKKG